MPSRASCTPDEFASYRDGGARQGLPAGRRPRRLTRSSYHAGDDFARLRAARRARRCGSRLPAPNRAASLPLPRGAPEPGLPSMPPAMPTHAEQRRAALHAGAALRSGRRCRALSGVPALVRRRAHPASASAELIVADLVIGFRCSASVSPRAVTLDRAAAHRRDLHRGAVPLSQQPLDVRSRSRAAGRASISSSISSSSRSLLQKIIGALFNEAVRRMVAAFEARAKKLYGGHTS